MTGIDRTRVVVLGGGTAGWMTAAALVRLLPTACTVDLVESAEIGIVGVGEATLPHIRAFVQRLGLDEADFMRATHATFKLGIDFRDFGAIGDSYIHPFGTFGRPLADVGFHHYWLRLAKEGRAGPIGDYSVAVAAAKGHRFAIPDGPADDLAASFGYAYQFDANLFGPYLRRFAEEHGARRTEGRVQSIDRHPETGDVRAVRLNTGMTIEGDLFVDCSGFRSLLLGDAMAEPWEDWSRWLPCDRAVAMPCASPAGPIEPYTRATAKSAGWQWRIPLQHRVGNGYVYSSAHLDDQAAADALVRSVEGAPLADPRFLKFRAGRRRNSWVGNVVGVGLASGFLEPLESTSIYLAQMAITQLIELFPQRAGTDGIAAGDRAEYNRMVDMEYDRIRDFLILHYHATRRDDSDFWNHVRTMDIPDTLAEKMDLFRRAGRVAHYSQGLFLEPSWIAVYLGQGIVPQAWDQRADGPALDTLERAVGKLRTQVADTAAAMPDHAAFLAHRNATIAA
ncbi:tryptophan halogenase family protein [Sphingomonas montana]|uniref:tryptophan halogenase family protein n=1 Tax=Sphingomonas montana TaxID=1843236 RepID=UPI00096EBB0F